MAKHNITIKELTVPVSAIRKLSPHERYAYYLLGHIFNELMYLQKLTSFAMPKHKDTRAVRLGPELAQTLFILRIAASKVWEADICLTKHAVASVLKQTIFPLFPEGRVMLDTLQIKLKKAKWLSHIRNKLSFHYPKMEDWRDVTTPTETWEDDSILMGDLSSNMFYSASESIAQHWMFGRIDMSDPKIGVRPMIEDMADLLSLMCTLLDELLTVFLREIILDGNTEPKQIGKVSAADINSFAIPFWIHNPSTKNSGNK
ncbi:hypothetical protein [Nitrosospira sp. Nsp13]|uniref:hypothetical protein n=1 Tax=Nitrosospira sp. Nsp13 TaxID=1855332 RepID=UPI00088DFAF9|nr:hypothetical protein [Nitrosospira sp. Nsp13]SCY13794.1 hypothetical protein SAMN05216308_104223 [Nitrosospira sp. Nsp13]